MMVRPMASAASTSRMMSATPIAIRRRDHRGSVSVSTCGRTRLTTLCRGVMAEARPAEVFGRVRVMIVEVAGYRARR